MAKDIAWVDAMGKSELTCFWCRHLSFTCFSAAVGEAVFANIMRIVLNINTRNGRVYLVAALGLMAV
jgi:hypothetical protein